MDFRRNQLIVGPERGSRVSQLDRWASSCGGYNETDTTMVISFLVPHACACPAKAKSDGTYPRSWPCSYGCVVFALPIRRLRLCSRAATQFLVRPRAGSLR